MQVRLEERICLSDRFLVVGVCLKDRKEFDGPLGLGRCALFLDLTQLGKPVHVGESATGRMFEANGG